MAMIILGKLLLFHRRGLRDALLSWRLEVVIGNHRGRLVESALSQRRRLHVDPATVALEHVQRSVLASGHGGNINRGGLLHLLLQVGVYDKSFFSITIIFR